MLAPWSASGASDVATATCTNSARTGCEMRVSLTFHQPLLVPLVGALIGTDPDGRIGLSADVTMVVN